MVPKTSLALLALLVVAFLGCTPASYGTFKEPGTRVETSRVSVIVPRDHLRVSVDNPNEGDVVLYEDIGPGWVHDLVFQVQTRGGHLGPDLIEDLRQFKGPEATLLGTAEVLRSKRAEDSVDFLVRIPPDQESMGDRSVIVRRQPIYMLGTLLNSGSRVNRLQVAWNPLVDMVDFERELELAESALESLRAATFFRE